MDKIKRIDIETKSKNSFIGCWSLENKKLMDDIVNFFNKNNQLHEVGKLVGGRIDRNVKDSIDMTIKPKTIKENKEYSLFMEYFNFLMSCYKDYQNQYSSLEIFSQLHMGPFNIQKYLIGGHFKKHHFERHDLATSHRLFAWMTYLNDIPNGQGETEFIYQDLKIKAEKGKTLIWPADWTHTHCGLPTTKEEKYIITGWFHIDEIEA